MARHPAAFLRANLSLHLWPIVATPALARYAFFPDNLPDADADRYWSLLQDESHLAYLDVMLFRLPRPRRVTTPVLVVGGEEDRIFVPAELQHTAAAYGGDPMMITGAAHDLMLDPRWEQCAAAIADWLDRRGL